LVGYAVARKNLTGRWKLNRSTTRGKRFFISISEAEETTRVLTKTNPISDDWNTISTTFFLLRNVKEVISNHGFYKTGISNWCHQRLVFSFGAWIMPIDKRFPTIQISKFARTFMNREYTSMFQRNIEVLKQPALISNNNYRGYFSCKNLEWTPRQF